MSALGQQPSSWRRTRFRRQAGPAPDARRSRRPGRACRMHRQDPVPLGRAGRRAARHAVARRHTARAPPAGLPDPLQPGSPGWLAPRAGAIPAVREAGRGQVQPPGRQRRRLRHGHERGRAPWWRAQQTGEPCRFAGRGRPAPHPAPAAARPRFCCELRTTALVGGRLCPPYADRPAQTPCRCQDRDRQQPRRQLLAHRQPARRRRPRDRTDHARRSWHGG